LVKKIVDCWGDIQYYNELNLLHREDGPAFIIPSRNYKEYWLNGRFIDIKTNEKLIIKMIIE